MEGKGLNLVTGLFPSLFSSFTASTSKLAVVQGRSQDFIEGGAQPSLAHQTIISPACWMYCAHILSAFSLET